MEYLEIAKTVALLVTIGFSVWVIIENKRTEKKIEELKKQLNNDWHARTICRPRYDKNTEGGRFWQDVEETAEDNFKEAYDVMVAHIPEAKEVYEHCFDVAERGIEVKL